MNESSARVPVLSTKNTMSPRLLEAHHVSTVPGAAIGLSPHLRISTATSAELHREACARIIEACASLRSES